MSAAILCTAAGMSDIVNKSRMCMKSMKLTEAIRHDPTFSCLSLLKSEPALLCPEELKSETNKQKVRLLCYMFMEQVEISAHFLHFQDPNTYKVKKNIYLI